MSTAPHPALKRLEDHIGLGPTFAARVLGVAYVTYAQIRCGDRPLKLYHARHIEALLLLEKPAIQTLIERYARGNNSKAA